MDRLGRRAGSGKALLDHLPLVNSIAVRVHNNLPVQVDLDDLIGAGIFGLCDAATTNDPRETSRLGIETGYRTCECCCTEFRAHHEFQPDRMSATGDLREMLMRAIETLPQRYQKVGIMYYTNNVTMPLTAAPNPPPET